jgi:hypothetical protein
MNHALSALAQLTLLCGLLGFGCDLPPDRRGAPDGGDGGGTDDLQGPASCPWNTGYPCTCDRVGEDCDDQSRCLFAAGDGDVGICSAACYEPYTPCVKTGFTASSECVLEGGGASFRCALVCEQDTDCPPDQTCVDLGWATLCHP